MRKSLFCCFTLAALLAVSPARAEVEWSVVRSLPIEGRPLDMVLSADNTRLFVLVDGTKVLVYSTGGMLQDTLVLDHPADGMEISKAGDLLYLTSGERKTVETLRIEFVQQIGTDGSPVKGLPDAPVTVAVFSDFQ
jgi:hypothetical protein